MYKVYLSQIKSQADFDLAVQKHIARLKAFAFEKGKPRPTTDPNIEYAIVRTQTKGKPDTYTAQYEIIDDVTPAPEPNEVN